MPAGGALDQRDKSVQAVGFFTLPWAAQNRAALCRLIERVDGRRAPGADGRPARADPGDRLIDIGKRRKCPRPRWLGRGLDRARHDAGARMSSAASAARSMIMPTVPASTGPTSATSSAARAILTSPWSRNWSNRLASRQGRCSTEGRVARWIMVQRGKYVVKYPPRRFLVRRGKSLCVFSFFLTSFDLARRRCAPANLDLPRFHSFAAGDATGDLVWAGCAAGASFGESDVNPAAQLRGGTFASSMLDDLVRRGDHCINRPTVILRSGGETIPLYQHAKDDTIGCNLSQECWPAGSRC